MKKTTKRWLLFAAALMLVGAAVYGGMMTMLQWDFSKLSTVKYETNEHSVAEAVQNVSIKTKTADILLVPSEDENVTVVCYEQKQVTHTVTVEDGTLVIEVVDTRKWYEYLSFSFRAPKITVYLPQGEYGDLKIQTSTADVEIAKEFQFASMDISESTGDVTCYASVVGPVTMKTSTGSICLRDLSAGSVNLSVTTGAVRVSNVVCEGDLKINVTTGDTDVTNVSCRNLTSTGKTGDLSLKRVVAAGAFSIQSSTGDVCFDGADAAEIFVTTSTGDVTGTLGSEKVFLTQTDTGSISVPKTSGGGKCEITTDTGDIELRIVPIA